MAVFEGRVAYIVSGGGGEGGGRGGDKEGGGGVRRGRRLDFSCRYTPQAVHVRVRIIRVVFFTASTLMSVSSSETLHHRTYDVRYRVNQVPVYVFLARENKKHAVIARAS